MTHSKMNPFIWVLIILMTLDALRNWLALRLF
ncbi:KPN_01571 family protein [Escherichia coli]